MLLAFMFWPAHPSSAQVRKWRAGRFKVLHEQGYQIQIHCICICIVLSCINTEYANLLFGAGSDTSGLLEVDFDDVHHVEVDVPWCGQWNFNEYICIYWYLICQLIMYVKLNQVIRKEVNQVWSQLLLAGWSSLWNNAAPVIRRYDQIYLQLNDFYLL